MMRAVLAQVDRTSMVRSASQAGPSQAHTMRRETSAVFRQFSEPQGVY